MSDRNIEILKTLALWVIVGLSSFALYCFNASGIKPPNYDSITASLTVLEIILALALVSGFWMIRGAAISAAEEAAIKEIRLQKSVEPTGGENPNPQKNKTVSVDDSGVTYEPQLKNTDGE